MFDVPILALEVWNVLLTSILFVIQCTGVVGSLGCPKMLQESQQINKFWILRTFALFEQCFNFPKTVFRSGWRLALMTIGSNHGHVGRTSRCPSIVPCRGDALFIHCSTRIRIPIMVHQVPSSFKVDKRIDQHGMTSFSMQARKMRLESVVVHFIPFFPIRTFGFHVSCTPR